MLKKEDTDTNMYTGPKIKTDGLVFGYDTGYTVSSLDTKTRFYQGAPATNLDATNAGAMGRTDKRPFETTAHSSHADVTNQPGVPKSPFPGMNVWKIYNSIPDNFSRYGLNYDMSTELTGYDKDYTTSLFLWIPSGITMGASNNLWTYQNSTGVDWHSWVGYNATYDSYGAGSIKSADKTADRTKTDQWQRLWQTWNPLTSNIVNVAGANNKFACVHFRPALIGSGSENYIYVTSLQTEEGSNRTPFTYEPRSVSGSLLDLTKTTDIDTSLLVFNSEGQPTWNGTTSYILMPYDNPTNIAGDISFEIIAKRTNSSASVLIHRDIQYSIRLQSDNSITWADSSNWSYASFGNIATNIIDNSYFHLVITKTGSTVTTYVNGKQINSKTFGAPITKKTVGTYIGQFANGTTKHTGEIPVVKVYNTILSPLEVQQQFRAYRTRFNI